MHILDALKGIFKSSDLFEFFLLHIPEVIVGIFGRGFDAHQQEFFLCIIITQVFKLVGILRLIQALCFFAFKVVLIKKGKLALLAEAVSKQEGMIFVQADHGSSPVVPFCNKVPGIAVAVLGVQVK